MLYSAKVIRCLIAFALSAFALNAEVRVAVVLPEGRELQAITKVTWDGKVVAFVKILADDISIHAKFYEAAGLTPNRFHGDMIASLLYGGGFDPFATRNKEFNLTFLFSNRWGEIGDPYERGADRYVYEGSTIVHPYQRHAWFPTVAHEFANEVPDSFALIVPIVANGPDGFAEREIKKRIRIFNGFMMPEQSTSNEQRESLAHALLKRMIFLGLDPPAQKRRLPGHFPKITVHVRYSDGTTGKLKRLAP